MWHNWSGRQRAENADRHFVYSEADASAIAVQADQQGQRLRVAGAGHSHSALVPNDGRVVDCAGLNGIISIDERNHRAWLWAGTPIYALGNALASHGLALHNQGDIDRQTVAGAISTGTHGTGQALRNLSSAVTGLRMATADGQLLEVSAGTNPEVFQAARLGLGAFGITTRVELQLRPRYVLAEQTWRCPFDELFPSFNELSTSHRHAEFFWYPQNDRAQVKVIDEVEAAPIYPLGAEGTRQAYSHEVLPNHRPHPHTEMEYSVAADLGPECFAAIRELLHNDFPNVRWPVEYRTLAGDDVWLSTAFNRPTVTISVHEGIDTNEEPYFRACEAVFREFDGRPHWGKLHYLGATELQPMYPRWSDWWRARDRIDPNKVFVNDHVARLGALT